MLRILKDKKGNTTLIYSLVLVFFLSVVTVLVLNGIEFRTLTLNIHHTAKTSLEEYINTETRNEIDSVKNGTDYILQLDEDVYVEYFTQALGISENLRGTTQNGRDFEIKNLEITSDENLDITLKFKLYMPFNVLDMQVITFDKELIINQKYTKKFI